MEPKMDTDWTSTMGKINISTSNDGLWCMSQANVRFIQKHIYYNKRNKIKNSVAVPCNEI